MDDADRIIGDLLHGIMHWAAQEDGVPDFIADAFNAGMMHLHWTYGDIALTACKPLPKIQEGERFNFSLGGASVGNRRRAIPHSANARLHWSERARWNQAWKIQAGWAARIARAGYTVDLAAHAQVTVVLHSFQLLDDDNAHAAAKPVIDGLKGILIADDSPQCIELRVCCSPVKRRADERVEVSVVFAAGRAE